MMMMPRSCKSGPGFFVCNMAILRLHWQIPIEWSSSWLKRRGMERSLN